MAPDCALTKIECLLVPIWRVALGSNHYLENHSSNLDINTASKIQKTVKSKFLMLCYTSILD